MWERKVNKKTRAKGKVANQKTAYTTSPIRKMEKSETKN